MSLHEPDIRFREIAHADMACVVALLSRGFPNRKPAVWLRAVRHLIKHEQPPGLPKYGYVMERHGAMVGVILTIFAAVRAGPAYAIRCNPCAWYVDPPFRAYAGLLFATALAHEHITYINVSAVPHTERMIEALGFLRYCNGTFVSVPLLNGLSREAGVKLFGVHRRLPFDVDAYEKDLLVRHAEHDCISLWCRHSGRSYPFVFRRRIVKNLVPCAQLIYCRAIGDFVRFAGPIGRYLALRGMFLVGVGANGPIPGLVGTFHSGVLPRYFKGPQPPGLADAAYTEFGVMGV
jgi:hypothetical protein